MNPYPSHIKKKEAKKAIKKELFKSKKPDELQNETKTINMNVNLLTTKQKISKNNTKPISKNTYLTKWDKMHDSIGINCSQQFLNTLPLTQQSIDQCLSNNAKTTESKTEELDNDRISVEEHAKYAYDEVNIVSDPCNKYTSYEYVFIFVYYFFT